MKTEKYKLSLYIAGKTHKSNKAVEILKKYCEEELKDQFTVDIIDLLEHPHLAAGEQIIAVPTLIKKLPTQSASWSAISTIKAKSWLALTS